MTVSGFHGNKFINKENQCIWVITIFTYTFILFYISIYTFMLYFIYSIILYL